MKVIPIFLILLTCHCICAYKKDTDLENLFEKFNSNYSADSEVAFFSILDSKNPRASSLFRKCLTDKREHIRKYAIWGLWNLKDKKAIKPIINLLKNDRSIKIKKAAAGALGALDAKEAIEVLISYLSHNDADLVCTCIESLGKLKAKKSIPFLVKIMKDPPKDCNLAWSPRVYVMKALEKINDKHSLKLLIPLLKEKDWDMVYFTARTIGNFKDKSATKALINCLSNHNNHSVRWVCCEEIAKSKDTNAVKPLIALIKDKNWEPKEAAIFAVGEIKDKKAIPELEQLFQNEKKFKNKLPLAIALAKLKSNISFDYLISNLNFDYNITREEIVLALGCLGNKKAIPYLKKLYVSETYYNVKSKIKEVLNDLNKKEQNALFDDKNEEEKNIKIKIPN